MKYISNKYILVYLLMLLTAGITHADWPVLKITFDSEVRQAQPVMENGVLLYCDWSNKDKSNSYNECTAPPNLNYCILSNWTFGAIVYSNDNMYGIANDQQNAPIYGSICDVRNGHVLYSRQSIGAGFTYVYEILERSITGGVETLWYVTTNYTGFPVLRAQWAQTGIIFETQVDVNVREINWCSAPLSSLRRLSTDGEVDCYPVVYERMVAWQRGASLNSLAKDIYACDIITGSPWRVRSANASDRQDSLNVSEEGIVWVYEKDYASAGNTNILHLRTWGGTHRLVFTTEKRLRNGKIWKSRWYGIEGNLSGNSNLITEISLDTHRQRIIGGSLGGIYFQDMVPEIGIDTNGTIAVIAEKDVYVLLRSEIREAVETGLVPSNAVTLDLIASGATYMKIGNTTDNWDSISWQPYVNVKPWTLDTNNGPARVWIQYWYTNANVNQKTRIGWYDAIVNGPVPFIDITNDVFTVDFGVIFAEIGGTNIHIAGQLSWSNSLSPGISYVLPGSNNFIATIDNLQVGDNVIEMWGTNIYGNFVSDTTTITRPPEPMPCIIITNSNRSVIYGVTEINVAGTNQNIAGALVWSNALNGITGTGLPAESHFDIMVTNISVGENVIYVWGTNIYGTSTLDTTTVIRLPEPMPFIDITNENCKVFMPDTSFSIGGTNRHIAGQLSWSNNLSPGVSYITPGSNYFTVLIDNLQTGMNTIYIWGTNMYGRMTNDTVYIYRVPRPFVDITNTPLSVSYGITTVMTGGTNLNIESSLAWSNSLVAGVSYFTPGSSNFTTEISTLVVGENIIHIWGTNAYGDYAWDTLLITRRAEPLPFIDITNTPISIEYGVTHASIGGSNINIAGFLYWSNTWSTGNGISVPLGDKFEITVTNLSVGVNRIYVWGTNQYGTYAFDATDVIRLPEPMPYIDVTNTTYNVYMPSSSLQVGGTNRHIAGQLSWTNNRVPGISYTTPIGDSFTSQIDNLQIGLNEIHIWGTNAYGRYTNDIFTVTRSYRPVIDITNSPITVSYGVTSAEIGGTNLNIAGEIAWSNSLDVTVFYVPPSGDDFTILVNSLYIGNNSIHVWGTNAYGITAHDSITIVRTPEPIPFINITNEPISVLYDTTHTSIAGTNANVQGSLFWSNNMEGIVHEFMPNGNSFTANVSNLQVGDNIITVWGTNEYGTFADDSIVITRYDISVAYIIITNGPRTVNYGVNAIGIGGVLNLIEPGQLYWSNSLALGTYSVESMNSNSFQTTVSNLYVGTNMIHVWGTVLGESHTTSDYVQITKTPNPLPEINITNEYRTVLYSIDSCTLAGTHNTNVTGMLWWENTIGDSGFITVSNTSWVIPYVPLHIGANYITVYCTNIYDTIAYDTYHIWRYSYDGSGEQGGTIKSMRIPGPLTAWGANSSGQTNVIAGDTYTAVAGGFNHSLALYEDGTLEGWGDNTYGQISIPFFINTFKACAAGEKHTVTLLGNGFIRVYGADDFGVISSRPTDNGYIAVASGKNHCLALRENGRITAWGSNSDGQTNCPATENFVSIAACGNSSLALRNDGTITCWGELSASYPCPSGSNYAAIALGTTHALALKTDQTIMGWGDNSYGQISCPSGSNFISIAAGDGYSVALRDNGLLSAWGNNSMGQCNAPPHAYKACAAAHAHNIAIVDNSYNPYIDITTTPFTVEYSVTQGSIAGTNYGIAGPLSWSNNVSTSSGVCTGTGNSFIAEITGLEEGVNTIFVFGTNMYGRYTYDTVAITRKDQGPYGIDITNSNFSVSYTTTTAMIGGTNLNIAGMLSWSNSLVPGVEHSFAAAGNDFSALIDDIRIGLNVIIVWGTNIYGSYTSDNIEITRKAESLPYIKITNVYTKVSYSTSVLAIAGTNAHIAGALRWNTEWGVSGSVDVTGADWIVSNIPLRLGYTTITVSGSNTYGTTTYDTIRIWHYNRDGGGEQSGSIYGMRASGSLISWGNNSSGQTNYPSKNDYTAIAAGYSHSLALLQDSSLIGWGSNSDGQISIPLFITTFSAMAAGEKHTVTLLDNGEIRVYGADTYDLLSTAPTDAMFEAVAAGKNHCLALTTNGNIIAWGDNANGQCDVPLGSNFLAIAAFDDNSIALRDDGTIAAWGVFGISYSIPSGSNYVAVSIGTDHALALKNDGTIIAWGDNSFGKIECPDGSNFVAIAAGDAHSLALRDTGMLEAWGSSLFNMTDVPADYTYKMAAAGRGHSIALIDAVIKPVIVITNGAVTVDYTVIYATIGGSNCHVLPPLTWTNNTTGTTGECEINGDYFSAIISNLDVGVNSIRVWGTNIYGTLAEDTITVTRLSEPLPVIDITNKNFAVAYSVVSANVYGTNLHVAGDLIWTNESGGTAGTCTVTGNSFEATVSQLTIGTNVIRVWGTNTYGTIGEDTMTITRLPEPLAVIDITNENFAVAYSVVSANVYGTNMHVAGDIIWTNESGGTAGTCTVVGNSFEATVNQLTIGTNIIRVWGTNIYGTYTEDITTITRLPEPLCVFFVYLFIIYTLYRKC